MLDSSQLARVSTLFDALVDESEEAIDVALADEADTEVAAEVRRLIAVDRDTRRGDTERLRSDVFDQFEAARAPAIPRYRLTGLIGRGGMGSVYRGERIDGSYVQTVAIKCLQTGWLDERQRRRFVRERQILAQLDHPGIARILDGGETEDHRPFVVIEHVNGRNILDFCQQESLDLRSRLTLVADLCDAVQFAHDNLVIHRDIKTANVLVDDSGQVKLLDFGIAMLLRESGQALTVEGSTAAMMTPAYASPEQLEGGRIGATSDVYSLGVVLCELICGSRPFAESEGSTGRLLAAMRERSPRLPRRAKNAGNSPIHRREVKGDVETIVLKALEFRSQERYPSAGVLADDIRAFLASRPIAARPQTLGYAFRRFCRRNPALASTSGLLIATLVFALAAYAWYYRELARQRGEAVSAQVSAVALADSNSFSLHNEEHREYLELLWKSVARNELYTADFARLGLRRADIVLKAGDVQTADSLVDELLARTEAELWKGPLLELDFLLYQARRARADESLIEAIWFYEDALSLAVELGQLADINAVRLRLAKALEAIGHFNDAIEYLNAIILADESSWDEREHAASSAANIANSIREYDWSLAFREQQKAAALKSNSSIHRKLWSLHSKIANTHALKGDFVAAERYARSSIAILELAVPDATPNSVIQRRHELARILLMKSKASLEAISMLEGVIEEIEDLPPANRYNLGMYKHEYAQALTDAEQPAKVISVVHQNRDFYMRRGKRGCALAIQLIDASIQALSGEMEAPVESAEFANQVREQFTSQCQNLPNERRPNPYLAIRACGAAGALWSMNPQKR